MCIAKLMYSYLGDSLRLIIVMCIITIPEIYAEHIFEQKGDRQPKKPITRVGPEILYKIPNDIKYSHSPKCFKNKLKAHIIIGYSY